MLILSEVGAEGLEGDGGDVHFVGEEALAIVGNDEVDFVSFDEELFEKSGRVNGSGSAGDSEDIA